MREEAFTSVLTPEHGVGREEMRTPDEVFEMRRLQSLGWADQSAVGLPSDDAVQGWLRRGRLRKAAMRSSRLPTVKRLADFDFTFQPSLRREQIDSLHELDFLRRKENVVFLGPPGVGKTHLAISLAIRAAETKGRRVYYGSLEGFGRVPPGGGDEGAVAAPAAGPHPPRAAGGGRDRLPAGDPERGDVVLPAHQRAVNSLWQNPHGVRPAIHPGQTAGDETHAAQFSRWGLGRRSIPAKQPVVKPTRPSSPGGGSAGDPSRPNSR